MRVISHTACRVFAISGWIVLAALYWIALAASWGFSPNALFLWSVPAALGSYLTSRWLSADRNRVVAGSDRLLTFVWVLLLALLVPLLVFADDPFWDGKERTLGSVVFAVYLAFPMALIGVMLRRVARVKPSDGSTLPSA